MADGKHDYAFCAADAESDAEAQLETVRKSAKCCFGAGQAHFADPDGEHSPRCRLRLPSYIQQLNFDKQHARVI